LEEKKNSQNRSGVAREMVCRGEGASGDFLFKGQGKIRKRVDRECPIRRRTDSVYAMG